MKKALKTAARGTVFPYAGEKWVALADEIRQQDYAMAMMDGSRKTMIGRAAAGV